MQFFKVFIYFYLISDYSWSDLDHCILLENREAAFRLNDNKTVWHVWVLFPAPTAILFVWCLHVFHTSMCVSSECSGFHPGVHYHSYTVTKNEPISFLSALLIATDHWWPGTPHKSFTHYTHIYAISSYNLALIKLVQMITPAYFEEENVYLRLNTFHPRSGE